MITPKKSLFLFCFLVLFFLPGAASAEKPFSDVQPEAVTYDLTVNAIPPYGGTVKADCTTPCQYDADAWAHLLAIPNSGYVFNYWDVDCTGSNPSVAVMMTGLKTCNANFLPCNTVTPFKMGAGYYGSFLEAYKLAAGGETIDILATTIQESLRLDRLIPVILKGGYRCWEESTPSSYTLLQGQMIFKDGAGTVENLMILSGTPPVITSFTANPSTIVAGNRTELEWTIADASSASIDLEEVDPINGTANVSPLTTTTYTLTAVNSYGYDSKQVTVTINEPEPPEIASFKASPDVISPGGSSKLTWEVSGAISVVIDQGIGSVDPASGSINVSPTTTTVYTITVTNAADTITKKITVGVIPPDPTAIAPPVDQTIATTVYDASSFLYTGSTPVQTGMAPETIEPKRVAVLRGKVLDDNGLPLVGVTVTLLNHPEYGQTITRPDGIFDMVVNGGGLMKVKYTKTGYLTVQRQKDIPWQDYMWLPEIRMIEADPNVTVVDLTSQSDFQVVRGSVITDERGTRQSTVLIPKGTQAWMVFPDGHEEPITSLTVRASEFTVGANGESKMPAELPPTSAYTYCEEFTVEEAVAAGVPEVRFSQMAISYNENFLNFPIGTGIPLGAYDRERGVWIPSDNGKVIKILNITGGLAEIDTDGDNIADNGVSLGITDAERAALANLYPIGQSLWRVLIPHFTRPWDMNMGVMCEEPCFDPKNPPPFAKDPKCVDEKTGSIIECQSQVLAENIPIAGTLYHLHYQSDRVRGRTEKYALAIPLTGSTISPTLRKITLAIEVAGKKIVREYDPGVNLSDTFTWDGKDVYGRDVQGNQTITVQIGYGYRLVYGFTNRFGYNGGGIPISVSTNYFTLWQVHKVPVGTIGTWDAKGQGLGGWTLNVHHAYDLNGWTIQGGDGEHYGAPGAIVKTVAGGGLVNGDGVQATGAYLPGPQAVAVSPDGSLYIAEYYNRIRRVGPDGIIITVAGTAAAGYSGDGGPATSAMLNYPEDMALGPDGSIYIADTRNHRVRRVGPDGIIATVAGNGTCSYCEYNCPPIVDAPATEVTLCNPRSVTVGPDGSLYILHPKSASVGISFIRRVAPDGIITRFAGADDQAAYACTGDGGPAVSAGICMPRRIRAGQDGSVYMTAIRRVRRVTPDGFINTVAGGDGYCSDSSTGVECGDGGPAAEAKFYYPSAIGMAGGQSGFFVTDPTLELVRQVGPDGIINTVVGSCCSYAYGFAGDGGLATQALFWQPVDVAMGPDGSLYIADSQNARIRKVSAAIPEMLLGFVPSEDGSQIYHFNLLGRHLETLDSLTGAVLYTFEYDSGGRLTKVTDRDGNFTAIQRDVSGNPTAILSPYGQQTNLTLDANGYLSSITNPAGETTAFTYTADGLMTSQTTPRNFAYTYSYDSLGRLQKDQDAVGGFQSLTRAEQTNGYDVTLTTSMGRATTYSLENLATGDQQQVTTYPDGTQTDTLNRKDGSSTTSLPDGTTIEALIGPDPRFSMVSPLLKSMTVKTPGGLTLNVSENLLVSLTDPSNPLSLTTLTDTIARNGQTYTTAYNAATKKFTNTTPAGRQSTSTIDALGRTIQSQQSGLSAIQYSYDPKGRLSEVTQGDGPEARRYTLQYNSQGYLSSITDALSNVLSFEYDQAGRLIKEILPDGRQANFSSDPNGNVTSVTPPGRSAHTFVYSPIDLMLGYDPPSIGLPASSTQYNYNVDRQITQISRPDGQTISFSYDAGGRPSTITTPDDSVTYTYDPSKGYVTGINRPGGNSLSYTYDGLLITGETWGGDIYGSVSWTYDNNFRITSISINGGNTISYQYDNDDLITNAGDLAITRNAHNGFLTGTTLGSLTDAWTYNPFGEPATYVASYNGISIFNEQLTYDKLGRITMKIESIGGVTVTYGYAYDTAGRLSTVTQNNVTTSTYTYDSNNNRLSYTGTVGTLNGTYDVQDRLTQYGSTTYSFTANGDLQNKTAGGTTLYNYDVFGNLKSITLPGGTLIEYILDGHNRPIGKKVNGTLVKGLLYQDILKPVAELDGSNNLVSQFIYSTGFNVPDYMIKGGTIYRIITDHMGSPRLVVNVSTGALAQRMDYDEFGKVIADTNPGFQPFGFAGGLYDHQTGLVHFGARDYDAETGRWTDKDPLLFWSGGSNLYEYVGGDPLNTIDPLGLAQPRVMNLFPKTEEKWPAVENFKCPPGYFCVAGHGNPDEALTPEKDPLTPQQMADAIKDHPEYKKGMKVLFTPCFTGKGTYSKRLGKILKTKVIAPTVKAIWNWRNTYEYDELGAAHSVPTNVRVNVGGKWWGGK